MRVTLVEDDPTVLSLLGELLRAHGHDPQLVLITGDDEIDGALDRVFAAKSPVVIMDLLMPISGMDLISAARREPRFEGVRFVVASASIQGKERLPPGLDENVRSISKPYDLPQLLGAILGQS